MAIKTVIDIEDGGIQIKTSQNSSQYVSVGELIELIGVIGLGYTEKILKRRLKLLSKAELQRFGKLFIRIQGEIEQLDDIIATRAEIENDPWK